MPTNRLFPLAVACLLTAAGVAEAQTYTIQTIAGNGQAFYNGDNVNALAASLWSPQDVAVDAAGNLYISVPLTHRIRKVDTNGVITTYAGTGTCNANAPGDGGLATAASLCRPMGLVVDKSGNLYIADADANRVRLVTPAGVISTFAGNGSAGFLGDGGPAGGSQLNTPLGLAIDNLGAIYIADSNNFRVRKVSGGTIVTVAGDGGVTHTFGENKPATEISINQPDGLAVDNFGNLFICASNDYQIKKVSGGLISTYAGGKADPSDGIPAKNAYLYAPHFMDVDLNGNLLIALGFGNKIRRVSAAAGTITTIAGNGTSGFSGDGGPSTAALVDGPHSVRADALGNLYIVDSNNNRIRKLTLNSSLTVSPSQATLGGLGGTVSVAVNATPFNYTWAVSSNADWISVLSGPGGSGNGAVFLSVTPNPTSTSRTGTISVDYATITLTQLGNDATSAVQFVPVTPCRVMDTRAGSGLSGAFGAPALIGGGTRTIPVPLSSCSIPASAKAYSVNATAVPSGPLYYMTLWPTGQNQPIVSTLNSFDGSVVANAAIVPAGVNGSISVYVTNNTDAILDINGYFVPVGTPNALAFFTLTPCRVLDTRFNTGFSGDFGPPLLTGGSPRSFTIPGSSCAVPSTARAYSMNATVVPPGPLAYLTAWPTGTPQPTVSTLNSFAGNIVANAAIVPAGVNGAVSLYASNSTDVILDINGFFGAGGAPSPLSFVPVAPCRVSDTRAGNGMSGAFGPPTMNAGEIRNIPIPASACGIPLTAHAYAVNVTVVPQGPLAYLTAWPAGQSQPVVSTLNSFGGGVVANAAIVPAGLGGAISIYVAGKTDVIVDINGYFAQ